ncbi:MAG: tRNA preQ1(34) S-adenosylmethionine ribosyltransferase-isomerase QueA [Tepidisphaeraceae bacterium]
MRTDELDFDLPADLIAQSPLPDRGGSRLLHYRRVDQSIEHRRFVEFPSLLGPHDLLVCNDTRVIAARFLLNKETGGAVEGLFVRERSLGRWEVMLRNLGPVRASATLRFVNATDVVARVLDSGGDGEYRLAVEPAEPAAKLLERIGRMPLPPYIKRDRRRDARDESDRERYQTVYAASPGSIAAPTAGLHFTPDILREIDRRGITRVAVTLHVGLGTFKPITTDLVEHHRMHEEQYEITPEAARALRAAKTRGSRIVAVGTTTARVLESQSAGAHFESKAASTSLLITPGFQWKHVGALLTNFHLPRSTLVALVAAMVGTEEQKRIYRTAIEQRYRFFSYGDAMLID